MNSLNFTRKFFLSIMIVILTLGGIVAISPFGESRENKIIPVFDIKKEEIVEENKVIMSGYYEGGFTEEQVKKIIADNKKKSGSSKKKSKFKVPIIQPPIIEEIVVPLSEPEKPIIEEKEEPVTKSLGFNTHINNSFRGFTIYNDEFWLVEYDKSCVYHLDSNGNNITNGFNLKLPDNALASYITIYNDEFYIGVNYYNSQTGKDWIYHVDKNGNNITAGLSAGNSFRTGITTNGTDFWYKATGKSVRHMDIDGNFIDSFNIDFGSYFLSSLITRDNGNTFYIFDYFYKLIYHIDNQGNYLDGFSTTNFGTYPTSMAYDGTNFFILDNEDNFIYNLNGGTGNPNSLSFSPISHSPYDITTNGSDFWYIDPSGSGSTIYHLDINGNLIDSFEHDKANYGIAIDGDNIWLSNYDKNWIYHVDKNGNNLSSGINLTESIPTKISVRGLTIYNNELWIVNIYPSSESVYHLDSAGNLIDSFTLYDKGISSSFGITTDDGINFYVSDFWANYIYHLDSAGNRLFINDINLTNYDFNKPLGLTKNINGFYIINRVNRFIYNIS